MEKNKDTLFNDMYDMMSSSSYTITQNIFPKKSIRINKTSSLSGKFCKQLTNLMKVLYKTSPRYIRCIKPNENKRPKDFNSTLSITQLRYSGVFEAVQIRKQGYPFRLLHKQFVYRYRCITRTPEGKWPGMKSSAITYFVFLFYTYFISH